MSVPDSNLTDAEKEQAVIKLKEELAELQAKLGNAGSELASMRGTKATLEAERDALKLKLDEKEKATPPASAEEAVKKVLEEQRQKDTLKIKEAAEKKFKELHSEFKAENDPGGLKYDAYKAHLNRISLAGLSSTEEFTEAFEDAFVLMNKNKQSPDRTIYPSPNLPANNSSPREADRNNLSYDEKVIMARIGWTEEQYLKMKEKRPAYVASLFKNLTN